MNRGEKHRSYSSPEEQMWLQESEQLRRKPGGIEQEKIEKWVLESGRHLDHQPYGLMWITREGNQIFGATKTTSELFKVEKKDLIGTHLQDHFKMGKVGKIQPGETMVLSSKKSPSPRWEVYCRVIPFHDDFITQVTFFDVEERERLKDKVSVLEGDLEARDKIILQKDHALNESYDNMTRIRAQVMGEVSRQVSDAILPSLQKLEKTSTGLARERLQSLRTHLEMLCQPHQRRIPDSVLKRLTPKQARIAEMIAKGMKTSQIADELGVQPNTILMHRKKMRANLGIGKDSTHLENLLQLEDMSGAM